MPKLVELISKLTAAATAEPLSEREVLIGQIDIAQSEFEEVDFLAQRKRRTAADVDAAGQRLADAKQRLVDFDEAQRLAEQRDAELPKRTAEIRAAIEVHGQNALALRESQRLCETKVRALIRDFGTESPLCTVFVPGVPEALLALVLGPAFSFERELSDQPTSRLSRWLTFARERCGIHFDKKR